jgi:hypothetical protein
LVVGGVVGVVVVVLLCVVLVLWFGVWFPEVPALVTAGVAATDPTAGYRFHRQLLQHLQWCRPTAGWALKCTAHQFTLPALWSVYPDALCIWPHRDPTEFVGSLLELQADVIDGILPDRVDRRALADVVIDGLEAGLDRVITAPEMDDDRLVHVHYQDVVSDPVATLRGIYARWDLPFDAAFGASIDNWLADPANQPHRHGRFTYDLETYGLTESTLQRRFAGYTQRFLTRDAAGSL